MKKFDPRVWFVFLFAIIACDNDEPGTKNTGLLQLSDIKVGTVTLNLNNTALNTSAPIDKPIVATFNVPLDQATVEQSISLKETISGTLVDLDFSFLNDDKSFSAAPTLPLKPLISYTLAISDQLMGTDGEKFPGYSISFNTVPGVMSLTNLLVEGTDALNTSRITNVPLTQAEIIITFSAPLDPATISNETIRVSTAGNAAPATFVVSGNQVTVTTSANTPLKDLAKYDLIVSNQVMGTNHETFQQYARSFYTTESTEPKFPIIPSEELLTLVQQQTFKYFWDFGHPVSGMARERNSSGDVVTTGGTGFGLMAILVGIERNFITREQGVERLSKIINFLATADRFHGAWPHWMNGVTGKVIPFSTNDNGGDLVETSFLIQGMLTVRQYLDPANATENALMAMISQLWEEVEWDWYTRGGQNVLYWHWSPTVEWTMNHQIRGHNETLITYVLAASSPTHAISANVYHEGYAKNGGIKNGKVFYDITLPLGEDYGGPLFFSHYSFLGLDPRNLTDTYANYWEQNVNHTLINREYVIANPKNFVGYSDHNWGLTASDNHNGYSAHSPLNDLGVISPTAALSSFPYTPAESMQALEFFYYVLGDRLWGTYGFKDAFNLTEGWFASSYLAIDQGPIVIMIENHRTALLWNLFMSDPEIQGGLTKLGFNF